MSDINNMHTCVEFLITDPRLGEPILSEGMPQKATAVSIEMLQPIRDAMIKKGFVAGEVSGGKPWGSGCLIGDGECKVSLFFYSVPSEERNRWESSIMIIPAPPLWRRVLGIRDQLAEGRMVKKVADELKPLLSECRSFTGVRWLSLERLCASKGYEDRNRVT